MSAKSDLIKKMLYATVNKEGDYLEELISEIGSHRDAKRVIFDAFVEKGINKHRAEVVTNMIMNKVIYGVEYPKDAETMIQIAMM